MEHRDPTRADDVQSDRRATAVVDGSEDRGAAGRAPRRRGFSLSELIVVLSVTAMLTSLLFPAMAGIRENAHRIVCASNQRQLTLGIVMYAGDSRGQLPYSSWVDTEVHPDGIKPWELMSGRHNSSPETNGWDGLGLLYLHGYCGAPTCFYCPSHHGDHPVERYEDLWKNDPQSLGNPTINPFPGDPIYNNYHYAGHVDWRNTRPRRLTEGDELVLTTDGLRTSSDFNHVQGMNVARADGSVIWDSQVSEITQSIPEHIGMDELPPGFDDLWGIIGNDR